jgi:MaoC dehydratase-like protein
MVDKSIVGTEMGGSFMMVERGKIMEFAKAILDDNPAYLTEDPPAPLTFTMASAHWPAPTGGGGGAKLTELGLGEIKAGDTLTSKSRISDVSEKEGKRGGTMTFITSETTFTNQRGEDVLLSRTILVQTSKAAS